MLCFVLWLLVSSRVVWCYWLLRGCVGWLLPLLMWGDCACVGFDACLCWWFTKCGFWWRCVLLCGLRVGFVSCMVGIVAIDAG